MAGFPNVTSLVKFELVYVLPGRTRDPLVACVATYGCMYVHNIFFPILYFCRTILFTIFIFITISR